MSAQSATSLQPVPVKENNPAPVTQSTGEDVLARMQETYDKIAQRAFDIFSENGKWIGHELDNWLHAESEFLHPLHLEITESDDSLSVRAEVPGFTNQELKIEVEPRRLTIEGKHETKEETKKGKTVYAERCAKEIQRVIELPSEVDSAKVIATLKDGVLTLDMRKSDRAKTVRVEPQAG